MSAQLTLENFFRGCMELGKLGEKARDKGLDSVESHNGDFIDQVRAEAVRIATERGHVCSDDLRRFAKARGLKPSHPNAWGALFRGSMWRCVGRKKSELRSNHAREIKIWGLA